MVINPSHRGDLSFYLDRQVTHLIHLAVGYAHDLGLTHVPVPYMADSHDGSLDAGQSEEAMYARGSGALVALQTLEKFHNLEEQRAYLGCYYLMSVYVSAPDYVENNLY